MSRPLPNIPRKCTIRYFSQNKKNNIQHFLNRPYIGIFMSLFGGLCLYLYLVFVYIWVIFDLSGLPPSGNIGNILFILTSLRNLRLWAGHCSYLSAPLGKGANWKIRKSWDLVPTSLTPPVMSNKWRARRALHSLLIFNQRDIIFFSGILFLNSDYYLKLAVHYVKNEGNLEIGHGIISDIM